MLESLRAIWQPHQQRELEVRFQLGILLNERLGPPTVRQSYGLGTVQRVARELDLDKSDISRMRRFAHRFGTFEAFRQKEPQATTSWTAVRKLIATERDSDAPTDSRALWGVLRSVKASIKALSRDHIFHGPKAAEIKSALQELIRLAQTKLDFRVE